MALQEYVDSMNVWLAQTQAQLTAYFQGCTQNELIAWAVLVVGVFLFFAGIVLFFI